jgi:hypothetical protein
MPSREKGRKGHSLRFNRPLSPVRFWGDNRRIAPYLSRHGILHGSVPNYATGVNSTRVFLLIDAIADLWLQKQKTLAAPC